MFHHMRLVGLLLLALVTLPLAGPAFCAQICRADRGSRLCPMDPPASDATTAERSGTARATVAGAPAATGLCTATAICCGTTTAVLPPASHAVATAALQLQVGTTHEPPHLTADPAPPPPPPNI